MYFIMIDKSDNLNKIILINFNLPRTPQEKLINLHI